jgi:hypothetical protein
MDSIINTENKTISLTLPLNVPINNFSTTLVGLTTTYPTIYVIYSSWCIEKIHVFLTNIGGDGSVGLLKIIYDNLSNESNKTIAVIKEHLYDKLIQLGYGNNNYNIDFKIKIYNLGDFLLPLPDRSNNLFIPTIKKVTETYVTEIVHNKLLALSNVGIIKENSWTIKCPIMSRETGIVKQGCFIFFKDVSIYDIATVRFLINNTFWDDKSDKKYDNMIKCHWAKYKNYH